MVNNPIIIMGIPRSGTSLVSGVFYNHGVWFGNCRPASEYNPKGFFENIEISALIVNKTFTKQKVISILKKEGYTGGPWAVKHSSNAYYLWDEFDPQFICCLRSLRTTYLSWVKMMGHTMSFTRFKHKYHKQRRIMEEMGDAFIDTNTLIQGNYSQLKRAFNTCGLEFNREIADDFIDPKLWNFK